MDCGTTLAGFGASAGFFALFFFGDVPRVRNDILTQIPVIGSYWVKEIHPADNVRILFSSEVHIPLLSIAPAIIRFPYHRIHKSRLSWPLFPGFRFGPNHVLVSNFILSLYT
ncbi:hypothetical protein DH86_00000843 [Scytalidium sp. 3C]|nr:hypothetical protein DH86_00000843 [Scytalidium sp. 3C]